MQVRRFFLSLAVVLLVAGPAHAGEPSQVDVVVVDGALDERTVEFVIERLQSSDADVIVLQMDVPAVLTSRVDDLVTAVAASPVPVAAWVGPDPASLHGGAIDVFAAAFHRGAAPGAAIGWWSPQLAGGDPRQSGDEIPARFVDDRVEIDAPVAGLVDVVSPSIGQFVIGLHGVEVVTADGVVALDTARTEIDDDGVEVLTPSGSVRFVERGLLDSVLHAMAQPEAVFFFLLLGAAFAVFEFYAAGPGVAAVVAAVCLFLAGYGLSILPIWWPAVGAIVLGLLLYVVEFQRNDLGWRSLLGTALLVFGGARLTDASPQLAQTLWVVIVIVLGTVLFFGFALTTVVRARFSTQTIGRDHLIGRTGTARQPITPTGVVEVDGALWQARSTRVSGIGEGDAVRIVRVDGVVLEVDPE